MGSSEAVQNVELRAWWRNIVGGLAAIELSRNVLLADRTRAFASSIFFASCLLSIQQKQ